MLNNKPMKQFIQLKLASCLSLYENQILYTYVRPPTPGGVFLGNVVMEFVKYLSRLRRAECWEEQEPEPELHRERARYTTKRKGTNDDPRIWLSPASLEGGSMDWVVEQSS